MDFGLVSLDSLVTPQLGFASLESEAKPKGHGSECFKQERAFGANDNDLRNPKKSRTEEFSTMLRSSSVLFDALPQQHMLSFSSPKSDPFSLTSDYYHSAYTRNAGLMSSGNLGTNMYGALPGARGPFTPSQWMELEHQALIYKYINANVPIPSNLLIPIRKALYPSGFNAFSGSFRPNTFGWGSFHMGFSGNNDPEPGRCRRTDGKKWRCSRDAVADQKYCERHMNRGRHRSRKPVEGQTGHAAAGPANAKVKAVASSSPAAVASGGALSNNLSIAQHVNSAGAGTADNPLSSSLINRNALKNGISGGRLQDSQAQAMLSRPINMKSSDTDISSLKQSIPCAESSRIDFGLASSDSLLDASQRNSYLDCRNFGTSEFDSQEPRSQDPLRHFIDDWPKNQSNSSTMGWSEVEENQSDRTQLSISIPMSSDFSSSSSSPTHDKLALSPLRLSREYDPIQMGLGLGSFPNEQTQRQANWIPISWESSVGGPLGEVLNHTNSTYGNRKNSSSALNLMTEGWNAGLQMELSPTGVLGKSSFGSLSNSSNGSSPRAENNVTREQRSLCDSMLT